MCENDANRTHGDFVGDPIALQRWGEVSVRCE